MRERARFKREAEFVKQRMHKVRLIQHRQHIRRFSQRALDNCIASPRFNGLSGCRATGGWPCRCARTSWPSSTNPTVRRSFGTKPNGRRSCERPAPIMRRIQTGAAATEQSSHLMMLVCNHWTDGWQARNAALKGLPKAEQAQLKLENRFNMCAWVGRGRPQTGPHMHCVGARRTNGPEQRNALGMHHWGGVAG